MLSDLVRQPFAVHYNYTNPIMRQRAQGLRVMIWTAVAFIIIYALVRVFAVMTGQVTDSTPVSLDVIIGMVVLVGAHLLIQTGRLETAVWLFIGVMLVPLVPATIIGVDPAAPVALLLPLVAGGILLGRRSLLLIMGIIVITMILRAVNQSQTLAVIRYIPADNALSELLGYAIFFGLPAIFLLVFSGSSERVAIASLADVQRLQAAAKFSERLQDVETETSVLTRALEVIQADLGFDLAQFYLGDENGRYTRRVRLGFGQLESGTRVTLRQSDENIISEAIASGQPVMVSADDEGVRIEHLTPSARQSVTLPLLYGRAVMGVLDVQSESREVFSENGINALRNVAAQTARELAQARRIDELERNVREQEGIINRFLNQMTELQQRTQSVSGTSWARYLQGRAQGGFGFDYEGGALISSNDLPEEIRHAVLQGDVYVDQHEGAQVVNVPILLRNQVLGALTFTIPGERAINERQIEMLRTVASRLGTALESNRLLEQTQAQAQRERKASEISSALLSVTDVEDVLDLAANTFNEALGAVRTRVYLEPGVLIASGEKS